MSTFSNSLRVELITQGDQAGQWGNTTNANFSDIFDVAIAGYQTVAVGPLANQALTYNNGPVSTASLNQSVYAMIRLTTTTTAAFAVYAPPVSKQYIIWNDSSYPATIYNSTVIGNTTAAGAGVVIAPGNKIAVFSDGTAFYEVQASNVTGVVAIANGGTGQTTANAAFNALAPNQSGQNGRYLKSDGTNASWDAIDISTADITGVLLPVNGGTGVANNNAATLTRSGNHALTITTTNTTSVVFPATGTLATLAGSEVLTSKTISGSNNTLSNIGNGSLTNSSITINGNSVSLGGSTTVTATATNALTFGTGLSGGSYNGSSAVTIALAAGYGDTLNPYASKTANTFLAAPNGTAGVPTFRAIAAADIPTLNQNTTGTAAGLSVTLAVGSGGTGLTSYTANGVLYASGASTLANGSNFVFDGTNVGIGASTPATYGKFVVGGTGSFISSLVSTSVTASDKPTFEFRKTENTPSVGTTNNQIGRISFYSQQGSTTTESAYINARDYRVGNISLPELKLATYSSTVSGETNYITLGTSGISFLSNSNNGFTFTGNKYVFDAGGDKFYVDPDAEFAGAVDVAGALTVATIPVVTTTGSQTLSNKTLSSNTVGTTQSNGDNSTKLATTAYVQNMGLGLSQTWQNVTTSRAFSTTYTNSTGKPIQVIVECTTVHPGGGVTLTVGGLALPNGFFYSGAIQGFSVSAIVPPGATYSAGAYGTVSYSRWLELR